MFSVVNGSALLKKLAFSEILEFIENDSTAREKEEEDISAIPDSSPSNRELQFDQ